MAGADVQTRVRMCADKLGAGARCSTLLPTSVRRRRVSPYQHSQSTSLSGWL